MENSRKFLPVDHPFNWAVFQEPSGQMKSVTQIVMDEIIQKMSREFNVKLATYLKQNLLKFGHKFDNEPDFQNFCSTRLKRISFEENPNYYEFYLDYLDEENKGKFVGCYSDDVEIINDGHKITAIFGRTAL